MRLLLLPAIQFPFPLLFFFLPRLIPAWIDQRVTKIGGRTYVERVEQPWFRYPHPDHEHVEAEKKEESAFGKHFIPEEDVFIRPFWTDEESLYLPCLTRQCVCPYFKGNFSFGQCYLKDGSLLQKAHRQEIRTLSDEKRRLWEATLSQMKSSGLYNRLSRIHKYSGVHSGPAFTIWHREFLKRLELVIRRHLLDINMGVPYWDSSLDAHLPDPKDSIIFSELFLGETDEKGFVVTGPYANWTTMEGKPHIYRKMTIWEGGELLNSARIDWLVHNENINMILGTSMPLTTCPVYHKLDARMLEYSHDYVHFYISGDMGHSYSSSNDVIFIYHHSMVDHIFEMWRQNKQSRLQRETQYPRSEPDCFPPWHNGDALMPFLNPFRNKDALSNNYTDEMYEFAPRPTCNRLNEDCGSKYLFCNYPNDGSDPECMSKVKIGGNCTGFEEADICFNGKCIAGRCRKAEKRLEKMEKRQRDNFFM